MSSSTIINYIEHRYGKDAYGNRKAFLNDNQHITGSELSRWIKKGYRVDLDTGDIYPPSNKKVVLVPHKND